MVKILVNPNQYLTDTWIGIYYLIIGFCSVNIGNYWLRGLKDLHKTFWHTTKKCENKSLN